MNLAPSTSPYQPKKLPRVPFETFLKKYQKGANGYKYEWNEGIVEKTTAMKQNELYIVDNLQERLFQLRLNKQGLLSQETEVWTSKVKWRKPDIAFFTKEQIQLSAVSLNNSHNNIPPFVIEVISTFDPINIVTNKVIEYFKAGVEVVWHIFPEQQMVYIFTSPKLITVCEGDDICTASPALPDFQIAAKDIFKQ
jgi:Uma2 family endonuclease